MGICFCCLSHDDLIARVLAKFQPIPASQTVVGAPVKAVGFAMALDQNNIIQSAIDGKQCVWIHLTVEEERERRYRDDEGREHVSHYWVTVIDTTAGKDFWLADGNTKTLIRASNTTEVQVKSSEDGFANRNVMDPSSGFRNGGGLFGAFNFLMGRRYRSSECRIELGEKVASLGIVQDAVDGFGRPCKQFLPLHKESVDEKWMEAQQWDDWDHRAFEVLTENAAVLVSDGPTECGNANPQPPAGGYVDVIAPSVGNVQAAYQAPPVVQQQYQQPPVQQPVYQQQQPVYQQQPPVQQPVYQQQPPVQQPVYQQQPPVQQQVYQPPVQQPGIVQQAQVVQPVQAQVAQIAQ